MSKINGKQRRSPSFCVGPNAKRVFGLACIEKVSLLVEVSWLFESFILKSLCFNRVLEVPKTNNKQRMSPTFCVGINAKRVLVSFVQKKVRLIIDVFRLLEKFNLIHLFSIGS